MIEENSSQNENPMVDVKAEKLQRFLTSKKHTGSMPEETRMLIEAKKHNPTKALLKVMKGIQSGKITPLMRAASCDNCGLKLSCPVRMEMLKLYAKDAGDQSVTPWQGCVVRLNAMAVFYSENRGKNPAEVLALERTFIKLLGDLDLRFLKNQLDGNVTIDKDLRENLKVVVNAGEALHRMKYGNKLTVQNERVITYEDIRKKMSSDEVKVVDGDFKVEKKEAGGVIDEKN